MIVKDKIVFPAGKQRDQRGREGGKETRGAGKEGRLEREAGKERWRLERQGRRELEWEKEESSRVVAVVAQCRAQSGAAGVNCRSAGIWRIGPKIAQNLVMPSPRAKPCRAITSSTKTGVKMNPRSMIIVAMC